MKNSKEYPAGAVIKTAFSLPRAQVQSLIEELRAHELCGAAKKKKTKKTSTMNKLTTQSTTGRGSKWIFLQSRYTDGQ